LDNVPGGFPIAPYDGVAELGFDDLSSAMTTLENGVRTALIHRGEHAEVFCENLQRITRKSIDLIRQHEVRPQTYGERPTAETATMLY
jgi:hypothetical protein